ncbi:hypothetical protein NMY22_g3899 [Coprinellus aureogranulatus]|nr:hypothetical protein NMY22_g3899 [Coprinellus aureogranulatus]
MTWVSDYRPFFVALPPKVDQAIAAYQYLPYNCVTRGARAKALRGEETVIITSGGLTAKGLDRSGERTITVLEWTEAARIHADRIRHYHGDAHADALLAHQQNVLSLASKQGSEAESWPIAVAYDIHQREAAASNAAHDLAPLDSAALQLVTNQVMIARMTALATASASSSQAGKRGPQRSPEAKSETGVPLSTLAGDERLTIDSIPSSDPILEGTSTSNGYRHAAIARGVNGRSGSRAVVELAADRVERFKSRTDSLEDHIEELEMLVHAFKGKVTEVAKEFDGLKDGLSTILEEYEAMETDHFDALAALEEESAAASHWLGCLRNAEVEIFHLHRVLPEDVDIHPSSQAKSLKPLYERYT